MMFLINNATFLFFGGLISAASAIQQNSLRGSAPISSNIPVQVQVQVSQGTGCSCGVKTNVLTCDNDEAKCFCNEDGNLVCVEAELVKDPLLPVPTISAPTKSSSTEEEGEEPIVSPTLPAQTLYSIDGCFCDDKTNVLSCDDSDDEEKCFCNEDGNSICKESIKLPPVGIAVSRASPIEEDESTECFCDDKTNVLSCDDSEKDKKCFCNEDGNLICEEPSILQARISSTPTRSSPTEEGAEEPITSPTTPTLPLYTIDGCFCDGKTNVLSCDDSENEDDCFCNEDGNLRCRAPPL